MDLQERSTLTRRTFVKGSLAGLAIAGAGTSALYGCASNNGGGESSGENGSGETDQIVWSQCTVNCGGACALRWHVKDGKLLYAETDNTGEAERAGCSPAS